jgi:hypothetical protein
MSACLAAPALQTSQLSANGHGQLIAIVSTSPPQSILVGHTMTPGDYIFAAAMTVVIVWIVAELSPQEHLVDRARR